MSKFVIRYLSRRSSAIDHLLSRVLFSRNRRVTETTLAKAFPGAELEAVTLQDLPEGTWSSPLHDGVILGKLILFCKPQRLLEVGTFKGFVSSIMATNAGRGAAITSVDIEQRDTAIHDRLRSRVRFIEGMFADAALPEPSYDFIFVDADHQFASVVQDSIRSLNVLEDDGTLVWHDYSPWGMGSGYNGVPNVLNTLGRHVNLCHVKDSNLVVFQPGDKSEAGKAVAVLKGLIR